MHCTPARVFIVPAKKKRPVWLVCLLLAEPADDWAKPYIQTAVEMGILMWCRRWVGWNYDCRT